MTRYSDERKEVVLKKMLPPTHRAIASLAQEEGISEATLYKWRKEARSQGRLLPEGDQSPDGWRSVDKFAAVLETITLSEAELSEYCRHRGLFPEQIHQWRQACEHANDWDRSQNQHLQATRQQDRQKIRDLEKDVRRKNKALAETAALLVLQKKLQAVWGDADV